jgi:hypothetical protein
MGEPVFEPLTPMSSREGAGAPRSAQKYAC